MVGVCLGHSGSFFCRGFVAGGDEDSGVVQMDQSGDGFYVCEVRLGYLVVGDVIFDDDCCPAPKSGSFSSVNNVIEYEE